MIMIGLKTHTKDPGCDIMLLRFLESFNNQPLMLMLGVGLAMIGGGIPNP